MAVWSHDPTYCCYNRGFPPAHALLVGCPCSSRTLFSQSIGPFSLHAPSYDSFLPRCFVFRVFPCTRFSPFAGTSTPLSQFLSRHHARLLACRLPSHDRTESLPSWVAIYMDASPSMSSLYACVVLGASLCFTEPCQGQHGYSLNTLLC